MDAVALTVGVAWALAGMLIIVACVPLVRGRVPRNELYGVRLPQAFTSDEAWYAINRFGGKRLMGWSVPLLVVGLACLFLRLQGRPVLALVLGFGPLLFLLVPVLQTWRFARRFRA